ncbi:DnaA/Hda family protein, partial [Pseudoalteromonas sp. S1650]|uniref:DnaA ATPase domain-containing protein n=1 Tax=Pseudoalteromonas sp. S1650 TaxID=579509 RepID=UPI001289F0BD
CIHAQERGLATMLLSMRDVKDYGPEVLEGLENLDVLCIDDVHLVAGNDSWEKLLFHFFNLFNEPVKYLVVTADLLPEIVHLNLTDLVSRL